MAEDVVHIFKLAIPRKTTPKSSIVNLFQDWKPTELSDEMKVNGGEGKTSLQCVSPI